MKLSEELNDAQRKAVIHGEGPMLVLAGPGSGKTFVITNRISYLIDHYKVEPANILVITFTKEAAINMKNRFLSSCHISQPVNFGTFHAIFYQILKSSGYCQTDAVLTDSEKKRYMIPILKDYIRELHTNYYPSDTFEGEAVKCLAAISCYKNTGDIEKSVNMLDEPFREDFVQIFESYEQKRMKNRRMDFDDMLYQCRKMLEEDAGALKSWQDRFTYLMIDEFQDINPRQYEIIQLLAGKRSNIFAVGDDDQSIYGFRGAEPGIMRQFLDDYPNCKRVLLNINYRSTPAIVEAAGLMISENKDRFGKDMKAFGKEKNGTVFLDHFVDKIQQNQFLAEKLKCCTIQQLNQTAVLFRTNSQMQGFASVLRKSNIPYSMKEKGKCIYDHFVAADVRNYILFACGNKSRSLFLTFMNKPYRRVMREALEEEQVSFDKIRRYYRKYLPNEELAVYLFPLGELEEGLEKLSGMTPYLGLQYLRHRMQYESYLRKKAGTDYKKLNEWMEVLDFLCSEAGEFRDYESWLQYQEAFRKEIQRKDHRKDEEGVRLMTVHASKGLEYDTVWVPDLNEGIYPYGHMQSNETIEEERRVLYVAMTRARKSLGITYVTGTKERPRLVSRFLNRLIETNLKNQRDQFS